LILILIVDVSAGFIISGLVLAIEYLTDSRS